MPVYEYTAISSSGREVKGSIDADTVRGARQKLRGQGVFPTSVKEGGAVKGEKSRDIKRFLRSDRVGLKDLSVSTRQFATLIGAGLALVNALNSLSDQTDSEALKRIFVNVREKVEEGSSLAKAMGTFPKVFPRLYVNMVASGEASGTLDTVLDNLADYLESQLELRRKIAASLFYPCLMFCFCVLVVVALLAFVVPSIVEIFEKEGGVLPLPTRITMGVSNFVLSYWWLLLVAGIGAVTLARWYYQKESGRERIDAIVLKLPIIGPLYLKINTARVSRTLGALLSSGVGLLTALDIAKNIVNNVHIKRIIENASDGVREGRSLAKELARGGIFPSLFPQMTAIGEQSGRLDAMLVKAGKSYDNEVNASLAGLTSLIEPIMIIILGAIVFFIVISVLLPIINMIDLIQR